jgi:hypothetical protein
LLWKRSQLEVRAAKPEELAMLQKDLSRDRRWEQVDLSKSVVGVVTKDGEIVQFVSGRLMWQVEPLKWIRGKKKALSPHQQRKATYLSIRWLRDWLADRKNNPYIRSYFCSISDANPVMQKLAKSFGMIPVYRGTSFFGEDLDP